MRRATTMPVLPPMMMPSRISPRPHPAMPWCRIVASTAMAMPIMPNRLPCRDVTGEDRPRSASTNSTAATRYASDVRLADMALALLFFLEHRQHALSYHEAAEDVHRGQGDRDETKCHRPAGRGEPCRQHGADDDHRGDRVGHRHQRRVERRRDVPD